jgi:hypothetical protein
MKKNYISATVFVFIFSACASSAAPVQSSVPSLSFDRAFWNTAPMGNELIFIGASPRYSLEEKSIQCALEDAARKVALFHFVEGNLTSYQRVGSSIWDYANVFDTNVDYDADYKKYIEDLVYNEKTDVLHIDNSVFVKTRYKGVFPAVRYDRSLSKGKPIWIEQMPRIEGYIVEVGFATSKVWLSETVNDSIENALFSLIKVMSSIVEGKDESYQGSGIFDLYDSSESTIRAHFSLNGFYVLDSWVDPDTKSVYALALAKDIK